MNTVTVSPKFQLLIPQVIREELRLRPGEKLRVMRYQYRLELIPIRRIEALRGFLKGIDSEIVVTAGRSR